MPESYQNNQNRGENFPLNPVPGTGGHQPDDSQVVCINMDAAASCCNDKYHRKLAIGAIVCGFSCCGVPALVYSVKAEDADQAEQAEQAEKAEKAEQVADNKSAKYLRQAKKWGIISIVTWVCILALAPAMMVLVSYLFTLID